MDHVLSFDMEVRSVDLQPATVCYEDCFLLENIFVCYKWQKYTSWDLLVTCEVMQATSQSVPPNYYPIMMLSSHCLCLSVSALVETLFDVSSVPGTITVCRWSSRYSSQGPAEGEGHSYISTVAARCADLHTSGNPSRSFSAKCCWRKALDL